MTVKNEVSSTNGKSDVTTFNFRPRFPVLSCASATEKTSFRLLSAMHVHYDFVLSSQTAK